MKDYVNFPKGISLAECQEIAKANNIRCDTFLWRLGYHCEVNSDFCNYRGYFNTHCDFSDMTLENAQNLELKKAHLLAGTDDCYTLILREKTKPFEIKVGMTAKEIQDNFKSLKEQKIIIEYLSKNTLIHNDDYALFKGNKCSSTFTNSNIDKKVVKIRGLNKYNSIVLEVE